MSLFGDLDVASASDDPWSVPDDTYKCVVSDLKVERSKAGNLGMLLTFTVTEGEYTGSEISDYKRIPSSEDKDQLVGKKAADALSFIKLRLGSLGIPESRMNSVTKEDLVGIECYVSTKRNGEYTNVRNVTLQDEANSSGSVAAANPFA